MKGNNVTGPVNSYGDQQTELLSHNFLPEKNHRGYQGRCTLASSMCWGKHPSGIETIIHKCAHLPQAILEVENAPTVDTVGMTLSVVLVQATGVFEEPVTSGVVVRVEAVCDQLVVVVKVGSTFTTVVMPGTLDVVLFETPLRGKVQFTIIAAVMIEGVPDVLPVRGPARETALTAIAIWHQSAQLKGTIAADMSGIRGPTRVSCGHVTTLEATRKTPHTS